MTGFLAWLLAAGRTHRENKRRGMLAFLLPIVAWSKR